MRTNSRDIALQHLKTSWAYIMSCIDAGNANDQDAQYDYHKDIFAKSLRFVEGCDRNYKKGNLRDWDEK